MLRVCIFSNVCGTVMKLEGALCGVQIDDLESCWQILRATSGDRSICIDLTEVTRVSGTGCDLLDAMRRDGVIVVERSERSPRRTGS